MIQQKLSPNIPGLILEQKYCLLIIGPSGSGKSTLEKTLVNIDPDRFRKAISFTTRLPRQGELDGYDYHFLTKEQFDNTTKVEHIQFGEHHYGLSEEEFIKDTSKHLICVVEPTGCGQILDYLKDTNSIYKPFLIYMNIDLDTRVKNMSEGRNDSLEDIKSRLEIDKIPEQFLERKQEFITKSSIFMNIDYLYPFLFQDILIAMNETTQFTFYWSMEEVSGLLIKNNWLWYQPEYKAFLNRDNPHLYSKITDVLSNRIICYTFGPLRTKLVVEQYKKYMDYV